MRKVAIVMGSDSDLSTMRAAAEALQALEIPHAVRVLSAHRTPDAARDFARAARADGFGAIIAAAGKASDIEITAKEILRLKEILNQILAKHSGKKLADVVRDTDRDYFMSAEQACAWGLIDKVIEEK